MEQNFLKFLKLIDDLKITPRWEGLTQWSGIGKDRHPEMVSDHSWKLSILVMAIIKEYNIKNVDMARCIELAIIHDLPEAVTGDISTRYIDNGTISKKSKAEGEQAAMEKILSTLSPSTQKYIWDIFNEYESAKTPEAILVKCLDKLDALLQCVHHSDLSEDNTVGDPCHFGEYGNKFFLKCPELKTFINHVKSELRKKYEEWNIEWKTEFDVKWEGE